MQEVMEEDQDLAIKARGVVKGYGSTLVLKGLDMDVPYGSIYGLLGSSGCGKTTLLRCILGQFNLAMGQITVLGEQPGTPGHSIPGKDVGYMPQEMALYGDFTMSETLYYFGILHGMTLKRVRARREFLQEFLELPAQNKLIRTLSGGQKRRFSFAVAMLQQPPLMILDEPTVGVDPILRAKIWEHLVELVSTSRTTIVITTHYIEEARQANVVGMMRDGRLLAEAPPADLIRSFRLNTLEDVFLQLCRKQDLESEGVTECRSLSSSPQKLSPTYETRSINSDPDESTPLIQSSTTDKSDVTVRTREPSTLSERVTLGASNFTSSVITSCKCTKNPLACLPRPVNIAALCWKNLMRIYRNPGLLIFQFFIPTFQIMLFSLAIGRNLHGIKIAYTNRDTGFIVNGFIVKLDLICDNTDVDNGLVNVSNLGELYISKLLHDRTFDMKEYDDVEDAIEQVRRGKAWAAIYLSENFTTYLLDRVCAINPSKCPLQFGNITNEVINGSSVHIYADVTNLQISVSIDNRTLAAYELFVDQVIQACSDRLDLNASLLAPPIKMEQPPIYGKSESSFTDYMAPGMITSIAFGISIGLCAIALILERNEGLIDRTWVAGVNVSEIIIAQVFTQFFILVVQMSLLIVVLIFGFKVYTANLQVLWVIGGLAVSQGLAGMSFGLFLSAVCSTENAAVQTAIAVFYPNMLLSGVLWPLEGMPTWIRYISYGLPSTFPAEAMRAIMGRGWGLEHFVVLRGFLMSYGWFFLFLIMTGVAFTLRK